MVTRNDFINISTYLEKEGISAQRISLTLAILNDLASNKTSDITLFVKKFLDAKKEDQTTVCSIFQKEYAETTTEVLTHVQDLLSEPLFEGGQFPFLKQWIDHSGSYFNAGGTFLETSASPITVLETPPKPRIDQNKPCPDINFHFRLMLEIAEMKSIKGERFCLINDLKEDSEISALLKERILPMLISSPTYEEFISGWEELYKNKAARSSDWEKLQEDIEHLTPYQIAIGEALAPALSDPKMTEQIINTIKEMYSINILDESDGKLSRCNTLNAAFKVALKDPSFEEIFAKKDKDELNAYFMDKLKCIDPQTIEKVPYKPATTTPEIFAYAEVLHKMIDHSNYAKTEAKAIWFFRMLLPKLQQFDV